MRVSIWQQFSSNHSADFALVGTFATVEDAESAAAQLRHILVTIQKWHHDIIDNYPEEVYDQWYKSLDYTPPEKEFMKQYNIEWSTHIETGKPLSIDWLIWGDQEKPTEEYVQVFRNVVFLNHFGQTWCGPSPFDRLIEKMGGKVASGHELIPIFGVEIEFDLPNDSIIAETLYDELFTTLNYYYMVAPPWIDHENFPHLPSIEGHLQLIDPTQRSLEITYRVLKALQEWKIFRFRENATFFVQQAVNELFLLEETGYKLLISKDQFTEQQLWDIGYRHPFKEQRIAGEIERDNTHVHMSFGLTIFSQDKSYLTFRNMIEYLESKQCHNLQFRFFGHEDYKT